MSCAQWKGKVDGRQFVRVTSMHGRARVHDLQLEVKRPCAPPSSLQTCHSNGGKGEPRWRVATSNGPEHSYLLRWKATTVLRRELNASGYLWVRASLKPDRLALHIPK